MAHIAAQRAMAASMRGMSCRSRKPTQIVQSELADEPITSMIDRAPGNDEPIGGIKVSANSGWFAARPSGTEEIHKIYAESFRDDAHLRRLRAEAQQIVDAALDTKEQA